MKRQTAAAGLGSVINELLQCWLNLDWFGMKSLDETQYNASESKTRKCSEDQKPPLEPQHLVRNQ